MPISAASASFSWIVSPVSKRNRPRCASYSAGRQEQRNASLRKGAAPQSGCISARGARSPSPEGHGSGKKSVSGSITSQSLSENVSRAFSSPHPQRSAGKLPRKHRPDFPGRRRQASPGRAFWCRSEDARAPAYPDRKYSRKIQRPEARPVGRASAHRRPSRRHSPARRR